VKVKKLRNQEKVWGVMKGASEEKKERKKKSEDQTLEVKRTTERTRFMLQEWSKGRC